MKATRFAGLCAALLLPAAAFASGCDSLDSLRWLLGDWAADGGARTFHESWHELGPSDFQGTGIERSKADGSVTAGEELRLVQMGDSVFYISKVSHNELPVAFRLTGCADGSYVFENVDHDFPGRLEYRRRGDRGLAVRVSGRAENGFTREFGRSEPPLLAGDRLLMAEDARFRAMVAAEREGMSRWFDEDLEYVHSTGVVQGRDQLIDAIASGSMRYLAVEPVERYVSILARDVALVHGIGRFRVAAGAEPMELLLHYTAVYVERNGEWRLRSWQSLQIPAKRSDS